MADETRNTVGGNARVGVVAQAHTMEAHFHTGTPLPPPRQLARRDRCFQNRDDEIVRVTRLATDPGPVAAPGGLATASAWPTDAEARETAAPAWARTVVISGVPGIGKSALAQEIGHRVAADYPDGVLHEDLDDYRGAEGAADLSELLGNLLGALGWPVEHLPEGQGPRLRQWRARTAGRRFLVILDGVVHPHEAVSLLPDSAASLLVVTTTQPTTSLVAETGAPEIRLEPLAERHAAALLTTFLGERRVSAEAGNLPDLLRLCDGLPLALRAVGSLLADHELRTIARAVAEIREEGLPVVEAIWDAGYRGLPAEAARLYRLLSDHPGSALCADAAVALLGAGRYVGEDALTALVRASLLERDRTHQDRFRFSALRRRHAERRARLDAGPREAEAAQRRLVRWYRRQAERADRLSRGERMRFAVPVPELPDAPDVDFPDGRTAARWVHRERHALYGSVPLAHQLGAPRDAWGLCEALWPHYDDQAVDGRAEEAFAVGVAAAQEDEDPRALARMRCQLAQPLWKSGDIGRAETALEPAVAAVDALGHDKLRASVLEFAGKLRLARHEPAAAARWFEAARRVHEDVGNDYGVVLQLHLLGRARRAEGRSGAARELLEDAHARAGRLRRERMVGRTAQELGGCCRELGETDTARDWYTTALESAERRDALPDQLTLHGELADLAEERGDRAAAERHRRTATELWTALATAEREADPSSDGTGGGQNPGAAAGGSRST